MSYIVINRIKSVINDRIFFVNRFLPHGILVAVVTRTDLRLCIVFKNPGSLCKGK